MSFEIFGLPPEVQKAMEQAADHQNMHIQADKHAVKDFLESLRKEYLDILDGMLYHASRNAEYAAFMRGQIVQIAYRNHKICPCGQGHDPDTEFAQGAPEQLPVEVRAENIKKYNLWIAPDDKLRCTKCGIEYSSLEDRMLKNPDDCHGCRTVAGQGGKFGPTPDGR